MPTPLGSPPAVLRRFSKARRLLPHEVIYESFYRDQSGCFATTPESARGIHHHVPHVVPGGASKKTYDLWESVRYLPLGVQPFYDAEGFRRLGLFLCEYCCLPVSGPVGVEYEAHLSPDSGYRVLA